MLPLVHPRGNWPTGLCHPSSGLLPPAVLSGLTGLGSSSVRGGLNCDSPPSGLSWHLYRLLIQGGSFARSWLMEWQCHMGSTQH